MKIEFLAHAVSSLGNSALPSVLLSQTEIRNMNASTIQITSAIFTNFDDLSLITTPQLEALIPGISNGQQLWYPWYSTRDGIIDVIINVFFVLILVIFGIIGNIMTLVVFRMYQKSSKSSATFLMQTLCMVDTGYLLFLAPTEWASNIFKFGLET